MSAEVDARPLNGEAWAVIPRERLTDSEAAGLGEAWRRALPDKRVVVLGEPMDIVPLDTLAAAWAAAEAALPANLSLTLQGSVVRRGEVYYAEARRDLTAAREGHGWETVEDAMGDTPTAALYELARRFRDPPA